MAMRTHRFTLEEDPRGFIGPVNPPAAYEIPFLHRFSTYWTGAILSIRVVVPH